jgi:hypothetical protein
MGSTLLLSLPAAKYKKAQLKKIKKKKKEKTTTPVT